MNTKPNCNTCGKYLGKEKAKHLVMLNNCGIFPKPYCNECFKEVQKIYKKPPARKSFAKT